MTKIGILSDTHLSNINNEFIDKINNCFSSCEIIIHAGDLTDLSVLSAFSDKDIYAVHGNMCNMQSKTSLPESKYFNIESCKIALCHGANGPRHNIEERLANQFPNADCIIYGHTHIPVCEEKNGTLFINPGSFASTGRFGFPGSYAILEISNKIMNAQLYQCQQP